MGEPLTPFTELRVSNRTCIDEAGRDASRHDLSSATWEYFEGCFFAKTYTALLVIFSCAISTFSEPFITK